MAVSLSHPAAQTPHSSRLIARDPGSFAPSPVLVGMGEKAAAAAAALTSCPPALRVAPRSWLLRREEGGRQREGGVGKNLGVSHNAALQTAGRWRAGEGGGCSNRAGRAGTVEGDRMTGRVRGMRHASSVPHPHFSGLSNLGLSLQQ